jgi:uncharacterized membrane protein YphA (DoxX/SURF4 family)
MKVLRNIIRILLGLVFVFSGFVKGVDPMGTAYKIEDYLIVYGAQWAEPMALTMSVLLCAFEFSLGIYLLLNLKPKTTTLLTLLLMVYFTVVTFFDALYNLVPDCGCFGDALKLSNWATFYKNIVLIAFAIFVFVLRKKFKPPYSSKNGIALFILIPALFIGFEIYNLRHLPVIDFTTWKPGNHMVPENLKPVNYFLVYENKQTKETKEFVSSNLPFNDSVWMSQWQYKDTRIEDPNIYLAPNFRILDSASTDITSTFMKDPGYVLFLVAVNTDAAKTESLKDFLPFYTKANQGGYTIIGLTSSPFDKVSAWKKSNSIDVDFYESDDTELKAMVRANPGLVLIKNGVVIKKWHYNDFPSYEAFSQKYPIN